MVIFWLFSHSIRFSTYICHLNHHLLTMKLQLTAPASVNARIKLPSSKSISNRALLISALCDDEPQVLNPALCDDTTAMIDALSHQENDLINVGPAGTAMRFLTVYFATREGVTVTLDGDARMRQRPIGPLVNALRSLGAHIDYPGHEDFPPLSIKGKKTERRRCHNASLCEFTIHLSNHDDPPSCGRWHHPPHGRHRVGALHPHDSSSHAPEGSTSGHHWRYHHGERQVQQ